jgi:hypothetical protein
VVPQLLGSRLSLEIFSVRLAVSCIWKSAGDCGLVHLALAHSLLSETVVFLKGIGAGRLRTLE